MDLRRALIEQSPSLALQREAQKEIARLDAMFEDIYRMTELYQHKVNFQTFDGASLTSNDEVLKELKQIITNYYKSSPVKHLDF